MPSHSESRVLPYKPEFIYAIVSDVERYPEFVPWCAGLRILARRNTTCGEVLLAETLVGYKALRERYISRVELEPHRRIDVAQTEGPFRQLENHWRFAPAGGECCRVDFSIKFEFKSRILGRVAGAALGLVMMQMTNAFEARARALSHPSTDSG